MESAFLNICWVHYCFGPQGPTYVVYLVLYVIFEKYVALLL